MRMNDFSIGILFGCLFFMLSCNESPLHIPDITIVSPELSAISINEEAEFLLVVDIIDMVSTIEKVQIQILSENKSVLYSKTEFPRANQYQIKNHLSFSAIEKEEIIISIEATNFEENTTKLEKKITLLQ